MVDVYTVIQTMNYSKNLVVIQQHVLFNNDVIIQLGGGNPRVFFPVQVYSCN